MIETAPFLPGEPRHVDGLVALFGAASSPCYCRYWHFTGDKNAWLERCYAESGRNEAELREAAAQRSEEASGVVALEGQQLVGWAKVAPHGVTQKFYEQRYYRGLPVLRERSTEGLYIIGCLLVHPEHRGKRVGHALVKRAVEYARDRGAKVLEAFPRRTAERVPDEQHWMGIESAFVEAGFTIVEATPPYPVYRVLFS